MFFLLTLYFQDVEHYSALRTGLAYLPFGVVIGLGIAGSSALVSKLGVKVLLCAGFAFVAAGILLLSRITVHGSYLTEALPGLVVMAFGSGICFATFGNASLHEVTGQDASLASGMQSTAQQVGGALGLAVLSTLALRQARASMVHGVASAVASTNGAAAAFRIGAAVALAGGVIIAVVRFGGPVRTATSAMPEKGSALAATMPEVAPAARLHIHPIEGSGDGLCGSYQRDKEPITVTPAEIIYQRRVAVLASGPRDRATWPGRVGTVGVSRTRYYEWKSVVERYGLDALMPKDGAGRRSCPNATPTHVVGRVADPGRGGADHRLSPVRRPAR